MPKPRNVGLLILLIIIFIVVWSTFVIVPAGNRGVVLWWGGVENRIMGEGLNFKVPIAENVIKVDVEGSTPSVQRDRCLLKRIPDGANDGDDELPYRSRFCE